MRDSIRHFAIDFIIFIFIIDAIFIISTMLPASAISAITPRPPRRFFFSRRRRDYFRR